LEEQSQAKGMSPTFSKSMVKRIGVFKKFVKSKQNEVKLFKIVQDRSKTNVFVSNCVEKEKRKKLIFVFLGEKSKKNEYNRSSTIEDLSLLFNPLPDGPFCPPPPCQMALGLIRPRKKEKKTGFDDVS
jgi:nitrogen regulatory protein PII-like uncharacterized protein